MVDMMVIVTFIPFLYIFGAGFRFASRVASVSGLAVTLIAMALSALPPPEVSSVAVFEMKVIGGSVVCAVFGWLVFRHYASKRGVKNLVTSRE
jgi:hypothetical protein